MNVNMASLDEIWGNIPNYPNKYKMKTVQKKMLMNDDTKNSMRLTNGNYYECNTEDMNTSLSIKITDVDVLKYFEKFTKQYQISHITEILKEYIESFKDSTKKVEYYEAQPESEGNNQNLLIYIIMTLCILLFIEKCKII